MYMRGLMLVPRVHDYRYISVCPDLRHELNHYSSKQLITACSNAVMQPSTR